jgi:hypothetical protein
MTKQKVAVIIGNGLSRLEYDLDEINKHAFTVGCNALYRDWTPDALVAVDVEISAEIAASGYTKKNDCYFRHWDMRVPTAQKDMVVAAFNTNTSHIVDNTNGEEEVVITGLTCVDSDLHVLPYNSLYIVGVPKGDKSHDLKEVGCDVEEKITMEFVGPNAVDVACHLGYRKIFMIGLDMKTKTTYNNVYAGSKHYRKKDEPENEKMPQVVYEMLRVFRENDDVQFIDVNAHERPKEWSEQANYQNVICSNTKSLVSLLTSE